MKYITYCTLKWLILRMWKNLERKIRRKNLTSLNVWLVQTNILRELISISSEVLKRVKSPQYKQNMLHCPFSDVNYRFQFLAQLIRPVMSRWKLRNKHEVCFTSNATWQAQVSKKLRSFQGDHVYRIKDLGSITPDYH